MTLELRGAQLAYDQRNGIPIIVVTLTDRSKEVFSRLTRENIARKVKIRIDGKVISAPYIREPIIGGIVQIIGPTLEDARTLAELLTKQGAQVQVEIVPD